MDSYGSQKKWQGQGAKSRSAGQWGVFVDTEAIEHSPLLPRIFGDRLKHERGFSSLNFPGGFITVLANLELYSTLVHASQEIFRG